MIFITGDTHGQYDFKKLRLFAAMHTELTKKDYLIIAGDFGAVWSPNTLSEDLKPYEELPCTVLFIDGNHENFDMLNSYPTKTWNGGKIHRITPSIIHLMRGQVFVIEGKSFLTMGGATSQDKSLRQERVSWWPEEVPTYEDFDEARKNLSEHKNKVDYIVTHSCDESSLYYPVLRNNISRRMTYHENQLLSNFENDVEYGHWYFGHYHVDVELDDRKTAIYYKIIQLV